MRNIFMDKYWVQQGHDIIHFKGRKQQQFKHFIPFKNLKAIEKHYMKQGGTYYVYRGAIKPNDMFGTYGFIDNKLKRLDNAHLGDD